MPTGFEWRPDTLGWKHWPARWVQLGPSEMKNYNGSAWFFLGPAGYHINSHTNSLVPHRNTSANRPCTLQGIGAAHCDALKTSRA